MTSLKRGYRVRLLNFDFPDNWLTATFAEAVSTGEARGFEFAVDRVEGNIRLETMATWSPISGLRMVES